MSDAFDLGIECEDPQERIEHLLQALETSRTIGQAQGLLMAEHGISHKEAFERLVTLSQDRNVKLQLVATELVARADDKG